MVVDWQQMILAIVKDVQRGQALGNISTKFHNTLAEIIVEIARTVGEQKIVLTGGCFQNKYLTERAVRRLLEEGFKPYWHQRVPPNDGGIALGQVMAVKHKA
jgi:hydrogenase maturation protein HypF